MIHLLLLLLLLLFFAVVTFAECEARAIHRNRVFI